MTAETSKTCRTEETDLSSEIVRHVQIASIKNQKPLHLPSHATKKILKFHKHEPANVATALPLHLGHAFLILAHVNIMCKSQLVRLEEVFPHSAHDNLCVYVNMIEN